MNLYEMAIPSFERALRVLQGLLDKAEAHFEAGPRDVAELPALRLAPDMNPFSFQVETAISNAMGATARLRGQPPPRQEPLENLADMRRALGGALGALRALKPGDLEGAEAREIVLPSPKGARHFQGLDYVRSLALPNVHFHVAIAYALLRANGVELGKRDFLGELPPRRATA